ncbi:hypothetical protein K1T71_006289 [Dendrolimus kikuchii]|uniref:Uncharacterized protein n=1 Tax=Dendrolimus kikuchii TaxID=765133 RepID=A0ACC1D3P5_9NEOP|nr:hypothetical protein K1T71_006289 [Dendrolimus kikuchii]
MLIYPRVLSSAAAILFTCVISAAALYYKSRHWEINEVMVFCKLQFNAYSCFDKLMSYIEAANKCVSVCMPGIHNPAIQGRLITLIKKKKIRVRIIIDRAGYNDSNDFLIKELIDTGAEIKCKSTIEAHSMQHKFCLIDDKVLMTGTLNWGNDRSSDHWNYVYITTKSRLVEPVKEEFYKMWNSSSNDIDPCYDVNGNTNNEETHNTDILITKTDCEDQTVRDTMTPELIIL